MSSDSETFYGNRIESRRTYLGTAIVPNPHCENALIYLKIGAELGGNYAIFDLLLVGALLRVCRSVRRHHSHVFVCVFAASPDAEEV